MTEWLDVGVRNVGSGGKTIKRDLDSIADSADKADKDLAKLGKSAAIIGGIIGTAIGGTAVMLFNGFKNATQSIKETITYAKQLGAQVGAFSQLDFAARSFDVTTKELSSSMENLQRVQTQAAKPGRELNKLFKQLNIDVVDAAGALRPTTELLRDVADLFQKMPDGTNKSALAMKLFGNENRNLITLLNQGSQGLDEMAKKSDELGYTIGDEVAEDVKKFYDKLDDVKLQIESLYRQALPGLLPLLNDFANLIDSQSFKDGFNTLIQGSMQAVVWLAKMSTEFANTVKTMSESAAAYMGGAALDDAERVGKELDRIGTRIERLQKFQNSSRVGQAFMGLGPVDPFAKSRDRSLGGVQGNAELAAQKELNILTARRGQLLQAQQDNARTAYELADKEERERVESMRKFLLDQEKPKPTPPTVDWTQLGRDPAKGQTDRAAERELRRLTNEYEQLMNVVDPVVAANIKLDEAEKTLAGAVKQGWVERDKANEYLEQYEYLLRDQLDPMNAVNEELERQFKVASLLGDEREVEIRLLGFLDMLKQDNIKLDKEQTQELRDQLVVLKEIDKLNSAKEQMLQGSQARDNEIFDRNLQAMKELLQGGDITGADAFGKANSMMGGIFDNSQQAYDLQVEQRAKFYRRIDELRQLDVINEQTAQQAKNQFENQLMQQRLDKYSTFFGALSQLAASENRELARIGKAAAVVDATIKGVQAVQNAYAQVPYPYNIAAAGAMAVVAAANVASIISQPLPAFRTGGSMTVGGSGGVDSQVVALRATPGEQININTPAQARAGEEGGDVTVNSPISVAVVSDREAAMAQMRQDPGMRKWIIEVIEEERGTVARAIGVK